MVNRFEQEQQNAMKNTVGNFSNSWLEIRGEMNVSLTAEREKWTFGQKQCLSPLSGVVMLLSGSSAYWW